MNEDAFNPDHTPLARARRYERQRRWDLYWEPALSGLAALALLGGLIFLAIGWGIGQ